MVEAEVKNWIVMQGTILNTVNGGGFEFFGPYTEQEAIMVKNHMDKCNHRPDIASIIVQLLRERWQ
jgi:hypothetical protein